MAVKIKRRYRQGGIQDMRNRKIKPPGRCIAWPAIDIFMDQTEKGQV